MHALRLDSCFTKHGLFISISQQYRCMRDLVVRNQVGNPSFRVQRRHYLSNLV